MCVMCVCGVCGVCGVCVCGVCGVCGVCVCVVWCVCVGQVECDAGNENMSVSVRECRRQNFECGEECVG